MEGWMIRYHLRGTGNTWKSRLDVNGDVMFFRSCDEAHDVKESLEVSHRDYSYNVCEYDASAL